MNSDLRKGYAEAAALLDPILADRVDGLWNPREARWRLFHFSTIDESTVPNFVLCLPEFVLSRCQSILLDSAESRPPMIGKPTLHQGFLLLSTVTE